MKILYYFLLFFLFGPLSAQVTLQRHPSIPEYVLGPGDQLQLHVTDLEEISDKSLRVDPGGYIDLPLAGRLHVGGMTLDQFKDQLGARLSPYINNPTITVNLTASESQPVSVIGQVNNPGVHQLAGSRRLLEVISMSSGLKPDAGPNIIVTRQPQWGAVEGPHAALDVVTGSTSVTIPVDALMSGKRPEDNIVIKPEDVISVPRAELVYVLGDVKKAGGFALSTHPSISVLKALSLAEGLGPDDAAQNARILRDLPDSDGVPKEIPVNLARILKGEDPDVTLVANDVLFVPHSGMKAASRRAIDAALGITTGLLVYR